MFPHPETANSDGLLALGGDLSARRLLLAYRYGIFPWYSEGDPIMWWSPDPRCVLFPDDLKVSKSMRKLLGRSPYRVTIDRDFSGVIQACSSNVRKGQDGTWITDEMIDAYENMHRLFYAHSVEVWEGEKLVAGLYGIALGSIFFGESMFTTISDGSKYGFIKFVHFLREEGFSLIDCQQDTKHLRSLGAITISRSDFLARLKENNRGVDVVRKWQGDLQ